MSHKTCSTLQDFIKAIAEQDLPYGLILYPPGNTSAPTFISYGDLYTQAREKSTILQRLHAFRPAQPVLLHLDTHWEAILWFWATLLANGIPVPSSPFSNVPEHRRKHIQALSVLLDSPICITTTKALELFDCDHVLRIFTTESLTTKVSDQYVDTCRDLRGGPDGTAMLMLTSGSTGDAKAVRLKHKQVLASIAGKASACELPPGKPFLNWIGMDHVAAVTEIHLHALYHGVSQVHIHASDVLCSPRIFLDLLSRHQVSRSFAPNFFLAKLAAEPEVRSPQAWNFQNLRFLVSGGEANDVATCLAVSSLLTEYGAPRNAIAPGFGMTETCAGSIYNVHCPHYDMQNNYTFASLGTCIKGIEMRITVPSDGEVASYAACNQTGDLEVRGEVVFDEYYHNEAATAAAFTTDGWFRTGDRAFIDSTGHLNLAGRSKDIMNINGVKISTSEVQSAIEKSLGSLVSRVICFPTKPTGSKTERVTVAYVPQESADKNEHIIQIYDIITRTSLLCTGAVPFAFALPDQNLLPKTTLGKISGVKMRSLFETGIFDKIIETHRDSLARGKAHSSNAAINESEAALLKDFVAVFGDLSNGLSVEDHIFDVGITSIDLVRLKHRIDSRLGLSIPITMLINHPTSRSMAAAIQNLHSTSEYKPVVTLRQGGDKMPLWLVHPGVGEVLVFLGLSAHLDDRPVYALRARGFDNEPRFADIADAVSTYCDAIRKHQPHGPYAIAGYSYGTMLAFEIAKVIECEGDEVRFLGSFNLPPHIKYRMRQLTWNMCLLHLAYFLDLISEERSESLEEEMRPLTRQEVMARVLDISDTSRRMELGLDGDKVARWVDVAYGLQSMATNYDPSGTVAAIDIFHAIPLRAAANSREDWVENHLSKWEDFCRTAPKFHRVEGAHYTMIGHGYVHGFATTLKRALAARGA